MISFMKDLRREANALFAKAGYPARPPFLRRAESDDYLLCSDAPRRLYDPLAASRLFLQAGYALRQEADLWFWDAPPDWYGRLSKSLPCAAPAMPEDETYLAVWSLCRMLLDHPCPVARQPLQPVRRTLKAMEAGQAQIVSLTESLPPRLAVLLRKKEPLPAMAGGLLACWLYDSIRKETV